MNSNEVAVSPSIVLIALFSADPETSATLDNFLQQFQTGLNHSNSSNLPTILCLYRKESEIACQFRLTKGAAPSRSASHSGSMKNQLEGFFKSEEVKNALKTNGHAYLIIAAHGSLRPSGLGISILIQFVLELFKAFWNWRKLWKQGGIRTIWQHILQPSLPTGVAIQSSPKLNSTGLTISELDEAVQQLYRAPNTLILHSCFLSGIEALHELQSIKHHIACETLLKGYMRASEWFHALENGLAEPEFTEAVFDPMGPPEIEGIFSSHRSSGASELVKLLNRLGRVLSEMLANSEAESIVSARNSSQVADNLDLVDLAKFTEQFDGGSFALEANQIICTMQYGYKITAGYSRKKGHRGISVLFPKKGSGLSVRDLPDGFKNAASDWMTFLDTWV